MTEVASGGKPRSVCRRHRITETTLYRWKAKFGDLQIPLARRLHALEEEDRRSRRLVADQALIIRLRKDVAGKDW